MMRNPADQRDTNEALRALRENVLASPALLNRLRATPDTNAFMVEAIRIAAELKLQLSANELLEALRGARRECRERWS